MTNGSSGQPQGIDVHHHIFAPEYLKELGRTADWSPEKSIEDMDAGGVAMGISSITQPGIWLGDNAQGRRLARIHNEYGATLVRDHPTRFGLFAALPLPDVEGSLIELEYAMDVLKADGVCLMTSYDDKWPGDPAFEPVFEEMNRRGIVVYSHPIAPTCCRGIVPGLGDGLIEWGTDTTRAIARVIFSGQAAKYPNVRYIWSHGGGTAPFLWERFKGHAETPAMKALLPQGVLFEMQRMFYDTAQVHNPMAIASLRQLVSAQQIVLGTDFPYRKAVEYAERLPSCGFSSAELQMINTDNVLKLMPHIGARLGMAVR